MDGVLKPLGGDEAELGAAAFQKRVGADRGRVGDGFSVAQDFLEAVARPLGGASRRVHEADFEVVVSGIRLAAEYLAIFQDDDVGESTADVDAD